MTEEQQPRRRGRPPTGVTPKRNVRIGPIWDRAEEMALEIARREGTVRLVRDHETGEMVERGNVTALVEEALRREIARLERARSR